MSLKKQAISGMTWTVIQQFGSSGISFIVSIILARLIAPKEFGIFALLLVFNTIGNSLSDSGMGESIIRGDNLEEEDYGTIFLTNFGLSITLYLVIIAVSPFIASFYEQPIITNLLWVYSLAIIFSSFSTIQMYRLTKELNFKKQAYIQIPSIIISGIVGIALGYMGYGVWALVISKVSQAFVLALQYWTFTGWRPKFIFSKEKFKYHFNFGYKLTLSGLLSQVISSIVTVIIGKFYSPAQLGYYTRAGNMRNFGVLNISTALNKVTYPLFSSVKSDKVRLLAAYKKIQNLVVFIMTPIMLLAIIIAKPLFLLLLGEEWLPSVIYFQLLCITGILYPIHSYNLNVLKVYGESGKFLLAETYKKINLLIIIGTTSWFGMIPLIIGLVIHSFISLFINMYFGSRQLNYKISDQTRDMLLTMLPGIIVFAILSCFIIFYPKIDQWYLILQIIFFIFTYLIVYLYLNAILKTEAFTNFKDIIANVPQLSKINNYFKIIGIE
ncbi:oligosaccharide flippase family protein [Flavobacteriaceae bacterium Ap0902]|nr:oligosaccharide flippase family protein [Flavobacteriaceae bacterium Ap0902]